MNGWLVTIIGVSFLSVLLDMVYPNGKTNSFCKSIFAIIIACVMINPLLEFKNENIELNYIDTALSENIIESKGIIIKRQIEQVLLSKGIAGVLVEIDGKMSENVFEIENIYVDISEIVLSDDLENINNYEVIQKSILEIIDIDLERIIIYG